MTLIDAQDGYMRLLPTSHGGGWHKPGGRHLKVVACGTANMRAVLKAQINKTDRNDARGMAQMMRAGLYRPVHVKTLRSQKLRMLLTHRKLLQSKAIAIDNDLRGTLRNFGLKVGMVG